MRTPAEVSAAFELRTVGHSLSEISRRIGVSRSQLRVWLNDDPSDLIDRRRNRGAATGCDGRCREVEPGAYAYLLGHYLGDGMLTIYKAQVPKLRIFTCDAYPGVRQECIDAISEVMPGRKVGLNPRQGCTEVVSHSTHWPCLIPQHGPGPKHLRPIALEPWQRAIVIERQPAALVRGLIHSDGCRAINRVTRRLPSGPKQYEYVRYFFSNTSIDIKAIFTEACERLGVEVRPNRPNSLSVATRASVDRLEELVGSKY